MVEAMAKAKARVDIELNQKVDHQATVPIVVCITLPRGARHLVKNATIATKRSPLDCRSKQHGCSPSQSKYNGSRQSCHDIHDIDQSQFDDAPQFEQDSITIEFKCASQWRHSNIMFDEISASASLQRVLTNVHVKSVGLGQSHWLQERFKIDSGVCGNLMPLGMYKSLYSKEPSASTISCSVCLLDYNKQEIKQLGTCIVLVRFRTIAKPVNFYIVLDRLKPIIGVSDALFLGLTSFHCPVYNNWHDKQDIDLSQSIVHILARCH